MKISSVGDIHKQTLVQEWIKKFDKYLIDRGFDCDDIKFSIEEIPFTGGDICFIIDYIPIKYHFSYLVNMRETVKILKDFNDKLLEDFKNIQPQKAKPQNYMPPVKNKRYLIRNGEMTIEKIEQDLIESDVTNIYAICNYWDESVEDAKLRLKYEFEQKQLSKQK